MGWPAPRRLVGTTLGCGSHRQPGRCRYRRRRTTAQPLDKRTQITPAPEPPFRRAHPGARRRIGIPTATRLYPNIRCRLLRYTTIRLVNAKKLPAGDDFLARLCVEWESCSVGVEALGARRVIARLGVVLSADGGALPKMALPFRLFVGSWLGSGQQQLSWIHLDDAVAALRFLLDQEKASGTYNVCAPQPLSNSAFSGELAHALRRPCWLRLPAFAMKLAFGEISQTLLEGQAAIPQRLTAAGFVHTYPDARSALEEIYGN